MMPVKTCLSSILTTRFDFGVPLEDVFPPNDIHPRLKYLFAKAYESYNKHGCNIEFILGQEQGSLKERLKLKEKLVLDLDYRVNLEEFHAGTHFWVIRHFLGLLPLPLLPQYTKGVQFHWGNLADNCKKFLQDHDYGQRDKHFLDFEIAQSLNMLPFENFLLLNMLMAFLRKLSTKNIRGRQIFNRKSMLILSKYYCSSIFVRPFRPGLCLKNNSHRPLLLYLILRWQKISKHCETIGHPAFFLESDIKNIETYQGFGQTDCCTQTNLDNAFFNPEVISVCRNIPYFVSICHNYLKDIGCQTETSFCMEKDTASYCPILEESETSEGNLKGKEKDANTVNEINKNEGDEAYKLAYIEEELDQKNDAENEIDNTLYQTAIDFSCVLNEQQQDWPNIVEETTNTVKKIEESYIYDDYETFKKEEFNQIGKNKTRLFLSKISKYGFSCTPPKTSAREKVKITSTPEKDSPESDISYVKYPDVCDDVNLKDHSNEQCKKVGSRSDHDKIKSKKSHQLFKGDSPVEVSADDSKQRLQNGDSEQTRKKNVLKRIRLSLEFLRALTPKKSTFKRIESRVKYHRIKNLKSNTI